MYEDERYVGKVRSALWCISLIYYLTDFQALILSTLEEKSPFTPLSCSTCDIMDGLSAFFLLWATTSVELCFRGGGSMKCRRE